MTITVDRIKGKLGVLMPSYSSLGDAFSVGLEAIKKGIYQPLLSLTQNGCITFPVTGKEAAIPIQSFVPLPAIQQIFPVKYDVTGFSGEEGLTKFDMAKKIIYAIGNLSEKINCSRLVMLWGSRKETFNGIKKVHETLENFEEGLCTNDPDISISMIHAYAALLLGIPFINGSVNIACEIPALKQLAAQTNTPFCGRKFRLVPRAIPRNLFRKLFPLSNSGLSTDRPVVDPSLYSDTAKLFPIVLDTVLFIDLAVRAGMQGDQHWLSFYFSKTKHEYGIASEEPSVELKKLQKALKHIRNIVMPSLTS